MTISIAIGQVNITLTVPPELIQKLLEAVTTPKSG